MCLYIHTSGVQFISLRFKASFILSFLVNDSLEFVDLLFVIVFDTAVSRIFFCPPISMMNIDVDCVAVINILKLLSFKGLHRCWEKACWSGRHASCLLLSLLPSSTFFFCFLLSSNLSPSVFSLFMSVCMRGVFSVFRREASVEKRNEEEREIDKTTKKKRRGRKKRKNKVLFSLES